MWPVLLCDASTYAPFDPTANILVLMAGKFQLTVQLTCPWLWRKRRHGLNREALSIAALSVATASAVQMVHIATAPATERKEQNEDFSQRFKKDLSTTTTSGNVAKASPMPFLTIPVSGASPGTGPSSPLFS